MSQRFSDAELAAEYWHNEWLYERLKFTGATGIIQCDRQSETLHRFAILPHAHEEPGTYVFQCKECDMRLETDKQHQREAFAHNHQYLAHDYYKEKP